MPTWQTNRHPSSSRTRLSATASPKVSATRAPATPSSAGPTAWPSSSTTGTPSRPSATPTSPCAGKLLDQIVEEQVPRAKELAPDLVSFCAGGNDIIRPGTDPDDVAARFERAVADLKENVGTVLVTTGFDTRNVPVLRHLRGKIATYTAHVRSIADRYDCPVLDLWSLRSVQDRRAWDGDRLHLSAEGHTRVALRAAQVLGLEIPVDPDQAWPPLPPRGTLEVRRDDIQWAREYLVPWIGRRLRGESSGDHVSAKRPDLMPL